MDTENKPPLASGIYFDRPNENAPSFVKGKISIKVDAAIELLKKHVGEDGYVRLDLKEAKETKKLYLTVNTWKPKSNDSASHDGTPTAGDYALGLND
jgi:hypothetical protein